MSHEKHSVYDTDFHLIIDPITRKISTESKKITLMQYDHNSERITFEIPRFIDGHDMSLCDEVQVHYINTDSTNKENTNSGIYIIDDLQVSPDSEEVVIGSWLVSQNATQYSGSLSFILRFACISETNVVEYQWFTDIYSVISIAKGIYNVEAITDIESVDVLAAWKRSIMKMITPYIDKVAEQFDSANKAAEQAKNSEENASQSATDAISSAASALASANNAMTSESNAKTSEQIASASAKLAQSYAVGGTGTRKEENYDNAKVYSQEAEHVANVALDRLREAGELLSIMESKVSETSFQLNVETGNLEYQCPNYSFKINTETGNLEWEMI